MTPEPVGSVLVVDDDFDLRTSVADILADEGYSVLTAANGAEALEELRIGARPDLILLDWMMPVMDGEAFCKTWHEDPDISAIPVVIFSAAGNAWEMYERSGASGLLRKPVDLAHLLQTVKRFAA